MLVDKSSKSNLAPKNGICFASNNINYLGTCKLNNVQAKLYILVSYREFSCENFNLNSYFNA